MTRLIAAVAIMLACAVAPASYAQDDCDDEAGECDGGAMDAGGVDDADDLSADADPEDVDEEDMAESEPQADEEALASLADDEADAETEDDSAMAETDDMDTAAGDDDVSAGGEEEEEEVVENDDDLDADFAAATEDDDVDDVDDVDDASASTPAAQTPAPPMTQTPGTPAPTPSARMPVPAAQANCTGGGVRRVPGGRCSSPAPAGPVTLYVGSLSWTLTEDDLKTLFEPFGTVSKAVIIRDQANGNRSRGFGFVTMPDRAQAEDAISRLNQTEVQGKTITVNESR